MYTLTRNAEHVLLIVTIQAVYFEARSSNHCCSGKAINITYCECVFVALGIQHRVRSAVLYFHLWAVRLHNIFTRHLINGTIFRKKSY